VAQVRFASPEDPDEVIVRHRAEGGRVQFGTPPFLVYGVVRVMLRE
jgi:hypothetical protein